jgi:radical SAM superfamily enzyme YgiQ (UPF0313 family)
MGIRVALVYPTKPGKIYSAAPPFGVAYLASYIEKYVKECEVTIIDGSRKCHIEKELIKFEPDIVGITATTPLAPEAYRIADFVRENLNALVVMGGVHASIMTAEALQYVDIVVRGEGEIAFYEIVKSVLRKKKLKEKVMSRPYIKNLDAIPMPAWHLLDMNFYLRFGPQHTYPIGESCKRTGLLITSRGCPFRCIFCYNSWRDIPVRFHSAQRVIDEIKFLIENYDIDSIFFYDDSFLANKIRLKEICQLLKETGLNKKIIFGCQSRADQIDLKTLRMIKEAGCTYIDIGFESGSERILGILKNHTITVKQNSKAIKLYKSVGIKVGGTFMVGTPTETKEDMLATLRFIKSHDLDRADVFVATPYPGTKLFYWCQELNLLPERIDYSKLDFGDKYVVCNTMPIEEFRRLFKLIRNEARALTASKQSNSITSLISRALRNPFKAISLPLSNPKKAFSYIKSCKFRLS